FFARHGDKAIIAARFLLGLRTWSAMLAGMARMPFWRFQLFSALGGLVWAAVIGIAGYWLGNNLALLESIARGIGIGGLTVLLLIALVLVAAGACIPPAMTPIPPPSNSTPRPPRTWAVPMLSARAAARSTGSADTPLMTM